MSAARMKVLFWSITAADGLLFLVLFIDLWSHPTAGDSGGREMGMFFFVLLPCIVLGLAVLLRVLTRSKLAHWIALLVVAGPGLIFAAVQLDNILLNREVEEAQLGRGYFTGHTMKAMGAAVVAGDEQTLHKLAPEVDINSEGENGTTLMSLAVERALVATVAPTAAKPVSVVTTLLALGARPDTGLAWSLRLPDPEILDALLKAGANPNQLSAGDQPVVFEWISVMPVSSLRLLIAHGLDVDANAYGNPLAFELTLHDRWDMLAVLMDAGADMRRAREDGRNAADEVDSKIADAIAGQRTPDRALLEIQARIKALSSAR